MVMCPCSRTQHVTDTWPCLCVFTFNCFGVNTHITKQLHSFEFSSQNLSHPSKCYWSKCSHSSKYWQSYGCPTWHRLGLYLQRSFSGPDLPPQVRDHRRDHHWYQWFCGGPGIATTFSPTQCNATTSGTSQDSTPLPSSTEAPGSLSSSTTTCSSIWTPSSSESWFSPLTGLNSSAPFAYPGQCAAWCNDFPLVTTRSWRQLSPLDQGLQVEVVSAACRDQPRTCPTNK